MTRFRAEKSEVVPERWHIFDLDLGLVARRESGRLAYFDSAAEAKRVAKEMEHQNGRSSR